MLENDSSYLNPKKFNRIYIKPNLPPEEQVVTSNSLGNINFKEGLLQGDGNLRAVRNLVAGPQHQTPVLKKQLVNNDP
jgi:hypothetical protein